MKCKECNGELEILRMCSRVRMQCRECGRQFQIHEVADQLDEKTEEMLSGYISIIYD